MAEQSTSERTLQEALDQYRASLRDTKAEDAQQLAHFVRWLGDSSLPLARIRPAQIESYGETTSKDKLAAPKRLEAVRGFLAWAKKQGWTDTNLATHLRLRRTGGSDGGNDVAGGNRIEVSHEGLLKLQAELESLKLNRPAIAEELRTAMADKDFRENAPLDAAREKQAHIEARIRELEATLKLATVVESGPEASGRARMGSRVTLTNLDDGREVTYTIVGPGEMDAKERKISVQSPVGRAIVNHAPGEVVEVTAPRGTIRFRLDSVES